MNAGASTKNCGVHAGAKAQVFLSLYGTTKVVPDTKLDSVTHRRVAHLRKFGSTSESAVSVH
jgi:hypothetical protein